MEDQHIAELRIIKEELAMLDAFMRTSIEAQSQILAKVNGTGWMDEHQKLMTYANNYHAKAKARLGLK